MFNFHLSVINPFYNVTANILFSENLFLLQTIFDRTVLCRFTDVGKSCLSRDF